MKKYSLTLFIVIITLTTNSCTQRSYNIGYSPLNNNTSDESINGNNGILSGATIIIDLFGMINSAYSLNRSSNHIDITRVNSFGSLIDEWFGILFWKKWSSGRDWKTIIEARNFDVSNFSIKNSDYNFSEEDIASYIDDSGTGSKIIDEKKLGSSFNDKNLTSYSTCCFRFEVL